VDLQFVGYVPTDFILSLLATADVSGSVLSDPNDLSAVRSVDDDIALRPDTAVRLGVEKHDPVKTLFGAAGNSLGEIRSARLGAIEFDRGFRVQLRGQNRGRSDRQVPRFSPEPAEILLPILPCMSFGQLHFVRRQVERIDGKIAFVCLGRIESATSGNER